MSQEAGSRQQARFDIFVSHSKHDKPVADAVVHTLEGRGWRCWIAPRDITPGQSWSEGIIDGLDASKVFVLIFSANANQSQHVLREVERAISKTRIVIPFRIEDVPPSRGLEYCISLPHWLDALTPPLQEHIDRLADTVAVIVGIPEAESSPVASSVAPPPPQPTQAQSASSEDSPRSAESPSSEDPWQRHLHAIARALDDPASDYEVLKRCLDQAKRIGRSLPEPLYARFTRRLHALKARRDRRRLLIGTTSGAVIITVSVVIAFSVMQASEASHRRQIIQRVQETAATGDVAAAFDLLERFDSRWRDAPEWIEVKTRLDSDRNALTKRQETLRAILDQAAAVPETDDFEFERLIKEGGTLLALEQPGLKHEFQLASAKLKLERLQKRKDSDERRAKDLADASTTVSALRQEVTALRHEAAQMPDYEFEQLCKRLQDGLNVLRGEPGLGSNQRAEIELYLTLLQETSRKRRDDRLAKDIASAGAAVKALQHDAPLMEDVEFEAERKELQDRLNALLGMPALDSDQRTEIELHLKILGEISRQRAKSARRNILFVELRSKSHIPRTGTATDAIRDYALILSRAAEACKSTDPQFAEDLLKTAREEAVWKGLYEVQAALPTDAAHLLPPDPAALGKLESRLSGLLKDYPLCPLQDELGEYARSVSAYQRRESGIADLQKFLGDDRMKSWYIVRETNNNAPYYLKDSKDVAGNTINRMQANGLDVPVRVIRGKLASAKPTPAPQTKLTSELEEIVAGWTGEKWANVCGRLARATIKANDVDPILRLVVLQEVLKTAAKGDPELKDWQAFRGFETEVKEKLNDDIGKDVDWADPISSEVAELRKKAEQFLNKASALDLTRIWDPTSSATSAVAGTLYTRYEAVGFMYQGQGEDQKDRYQVYLAPLPRGSSEIFASVPEVESIPTTQRHHFVVVGHHKNGVVTPTAELQKHYTPGRLVFQSVPAK